MSIVKNVLNELKDSKGCKFVGLEYTNKQNETSKYTVLVGVSYENWINKKIQAIESLDQNDLKTISINKNIDLDIVETAKDELLTSLVNNKNKETASNQSKGQNEVYISLKSGARMHLESKTIQVYGLLINRKVIKAGEPKKKVNSRPKTIVKKAIEKYLNFSKFVTFNIENKDTVINMTGNTFTNL